MTNLLDLTYSELEAFVVEDLKEARFRTGQIWQWLWQKGCDDFSQMTNIAKPLRDKIAAMSTIRMPQVARVQQSKLDGTTKFLLKLHDGKLIESVLIPMQDRYSLCLSTQVGCAMACTFCNTGLLGFERNLTMGEILGQVLVARRFIDENQLMPLKNLVYMGMGEPLMNLDNLLRALETLPHKSGLNISWRRSMVSSVGLPKQLEILGKTELSLPAISLHAPTQELRAKIMPKAAKVHIDDLLRCMDNYPMRNRERITYEYLLLKDVNDSLEQADQLAKLLKNKRCKVNLIPYNATEDMPYKQPSRDKVEAFEKRLWSHGMTAFIRRSMGSDIKAACGQLKADS